MSKDSETFTLTGNFQTVERKAVTGTIRVRPIGGPDTTARVAAIEPPPPREWRWYMWRPWRRVRPKSWDEEQNMSTFSLRLPVGQDYRAVTRLEDGRGMPPFEFHGPDASASINLSDVVPLEWKP